jgi:hypothetical protein
LFPIHRSFSSCGREFLSTFKLIRPGVQRVDPHHSRGYRELRSPAEMRKLLNRKIVQQAGYAPSATKTSRITALSSRTTRIRKERAERRDDHPDNIQATHWWCNEERD